MNPEDRNYLEQLYRETYPRLMIYASCALEGEALAEDAVQETFRIACAKLQILRASPNPMGWLMNTLKNVIQNTRRSRAALSRLVVASLSQNGGVEPAAPEEPNVDLLYADLQENDDFTLLKRLALEGRSISELSAELGISPEACRKRVQRARERLQKKMKKYEKDEK